MKSIAIVSAIAAAALGFGSLSHAQGYDRGDRDWRGADRQGQYSQRQYDPRQAETRQYDQRQFDRRAYDGQYRQRDNYSRGEAWRHDGDYARHGQWSARAPQYRRGDHLPYQFRQRQYYVNDWRAHRLYAPPYGYQWVQADGGDYLLVALATGLIANLLINQ